MKDIKEIYTLLLHSNGLKIREIAKTLGKDNYYVAELLFSVECIKYWYQNEDSLWFAIEGAIKVENEEEKQENPLYAPANKEKNYNIHRYIEGVRSNALRRYISEVKKYRVYTEQECQELIKKYRGGDSKALDLLVKSQQRLIINISRLYREKGVSLEDLIQEGNLGLLKAIDNYDATIGFPFIEYIKSHILSKITSCIGVYHSAVRIPLNRLLLIRRKIKEKERYEQLNGFSPSVYDLDWEATIKDCDIKHLFSLCENWDCLFESIDEETFKAEDSFIPDKKMIKESVFDEIIYQCYYSLDTRAREMVLDCFCHEDEPTLRIRTIAEKNYLTRERARQIVTNSLDKLKRIFLNKFSPSLYEPVSDKDDSSSEELKNRKQIFADEYWNKKWGYKEEKEDSTPILKLLSLESGGNTRQKTQEKKTKKVWSATEKKRFRLYCRLGYSIPELAILFNTSLEEIKLMLCTQNVESNIK